MSAKAVPERCTFIDRGGNQCRRARDHDAATRRHVVFDAHGRILTYIDLTAPSTTAEGAP